MTIVVRPPFMARKDPPGVKRGCPGGRGSHILINAQVQQPAVSFMAHSLAYRGTRDGSDYAALGLGLSVAVSDFSRRSASSARFARAQVMNAIMQPNRGPPPTLPPRIAPTPQLPRSPIGRAGMHLPMAISELAKVLAALCQTNLHAHPLFKCKVRMQLLQTIVELPQLELSNVA